MSFCALNFDGLFCVVSSAAVTSYERSKKLSCTRMCLSWILLSRLRPLPMWLLTTVQLWWRFTIFHTLNYIGRADIVAKDIPCAAIVIIPKQLVILCRGAAPLSTFMYLCIHVWMYSCIWSKCWEKGCLDWCSTGHVCLRRDFTVLLWEEAVGSSERLDASSANKTRVGRNSALKVGL